VARPHRGARMHASAFYDSVLTGSIDRGLRVCEPGGEGPDARRPKLLDQVRTTLRLHHYSRRTEHAYVGWIRRYILFHGKRHPAEMGAEEASHFLSALAVDGKVSASTQNQALAALLFLYDRVLGTRLPWLDQMVRAARPRRLPVVLSRDEVRAVLARLHGVPQLMVLLLYGAGLRLLECARLRVKDIEFDANRIVVRGGKGDKDRVTVFPGAARPLLLRHLELVREQHARDLAAGSRLGRVAWCACPEVPGRREGVALAMGLSSDAHLRRPGERRATTAPPPRDCTPEGGSSRGP
jgi:integrase